MKKRILFPVAAAVLAFTVMQFAGCEHYVLPELTLSPDTLYFNAQADSQMVSVNTNVIWYRDDDASRTDWFSFSPEDGEGSAVMAVRVKANTGSDRNIGIVFRSETISRTLHIFQKGEGDQTDQ